MRYNLWLFVLGLALLCTLCLWLTTDGKHGLKAFNAMQPTTLVSMIANSLRTFRALVSDRIDKATAPLRERTQRRTTVPSEP